MEPSKYHKEGEPSKLYFVLLNKQVQQGTAGLILNTWTEQSCLWGESFIKSDPGPNLLVCVWNDIVLVLEWAPALQLRVEKEQEYDFWSINFCTSVLQLCQCCDNINSFKVGI